MSALAGPARRASATSGPRKALNVSSVPPPPPGREEIPSLRTEDTKFFLEPDGSHAAEVHGGPIHFRDENGDWQEIDTTIVPYEAPGFAWQNKAGGIFTRFAEDARSTDMVQVGDDVGSVGFGAAGALPEVRPLVEGSRIAYPEVYLGIDMVFEVTRRGLKESIVLKEAPRIPPVFTFPLTLDGLTARQEEGGEISLLGPDGEPRFTIPKGWMTDSNVDPQSGEAAFSEVDIRLDAPEQNPVVVVIPDFRWLIDPARVYPVTIDPSTGRNVSDDTFVQSNICCTPQNNSYELKAGTYDGGTTKARSLFHFDGIVGAFAGKQILDADFWIYEFHSWSCSARQVNLYRVSSSWADDIVWSEQPGIDTPAKATLNVAKGYSGSCPEGWITFSDPDLTNTVANWVSESHPNHGLEIRANSETDSFGWKKFDSLDSGNGPFLWIVYNTKPTIPTLDSPANGATVPTVVPVLKANSTDADGDPLYYQFQVANDAGFTQVVVSSPWLPTTNTWTVTPGALKDGQTYYWRARAKDEDASTDWSGGRSFLTRVLKLGFSSSWPMWSHDVISVNRANGNLTVSLPGPSYPTAAGSMGAALSFNSLDPANQGLGAGWVLDAGETLSSPPEKLIDHNLLTGSAKFDAVEMVFPGGGATFYTHVGGSTSYLPPPGENSQLKKDPQVNTWTLVDEDGAIYSFGVADSSTGVANLTRAEIVDASPGLGKLTYSFSGTPPKIASITDTADRSLSFKWNILNPTDCSTAILCVTGPDAVIWRFVGDDSGGTNGKLFKVNDGIRDLYAISYDASNRINKIQNANDLDPTNASPGYDGTHAITIGYDGSNRVSTVTGGPVTGQTPTNSTWTLAYTVNPGQIQTTATRAPHENLQQGSIRLADGFTTLTPPNQQGQQNPKFTKVFFDNLGQLMETQDELGNITMVSYDSSGRELWTEDEEGNPTDNSWDLVNNVLLTVTGPDPDGAGSLPRPVTTYRYDETKIGTSSTPGPSLQGLQASYYDTKNLVSVSYGGRPVVRQTDASVDFAWADNGPPALGTQTDNFSIRWTGNLVVTSEGDYTLSTLADDGTRLVVDGVHAIENWTDGGVRTKSSKPIHLTVGSHKLLLEYYDSTSTSEVHLRYACTACTPSIPDQVIPSSALQPAWLNQTSAVSPGGKVRFHHFLEPASGRPDYHLQLLSDGTNVITAYEYEPAPSIRRITRKILPKGNASRTIDANGNLTGTPDPTYATTWVYYLASDTPPIPAACGGGTGPAQAGLLKSMQHAGIAAETSVYDSAGRAIAVTNGAGISCNTYDPEGRLTSDKVPGESQATTYTYDPAGATRTATDANGTVTFEYDEAGRVKRSLDSFGAEATFAYDANGNLLTRVAAKGALGSNPNYTTNYVYDAADRLTRLTDPGNRSWDFYYDARGNLHATQYPNGTFSWSDYNAAGWLTAVYNRHGTLTPPLPGTVPADSQGSPIVDYVYAYNIQGQKTSEVRSGGGLPTQTTTYDIYDALDRLFQVSLPSGTVRVYAYDLDSNRSSITENSVVVVTYTYNPTQTPGLDQLTSFTQGLQTTTFAYDPDGQTTGKGSATITWDGRGRTTGGTFSGTTVSYVFDASGRRRQRTGAGVVTRYLFAGGGDAPLFLTNGSGTITKTEVDGPAGDLAQYSGAPGGLTPLAYLYYTGHGDLAATSDNSGTRTAAFTYDPFGAALESPPSNTTVERWAGRWDKQLDTTSLFIQMGARPYDPALGRFLAVDPVEGGSINTYDYAGQNPVNNYDLDGEFVIALPALGWLIAVGAASVATFLAARRAGQALSGYRFTGRFGRGSITHARAKPSRWELPSNRHPGVRWHNYRFYGRGSRPPALPPGPHRGWHRWVGGGLVGSYAVCRAMNSCRS